MSRIPAVVVGLNNSWVAPEARATISKMRRKIIHPLHFWELASGLAHLQKKITDLSHPASGKPPLRLVQRITELPLVASNALPEH
jgi:hypothetical protein